jgi:hypothetical protein
MTMTAPAPKRNRTASSTHLTLGTRLNLETTRPSATTSALELAALALDVRLLVGVRTEAEVLESLTAVLWSTEEQSVGPGGEASSDLIDGEGLTAGSLDACASCGGEAECCDGQLGNLEETDVVSHGADLILLATTFFVRNWTPYDDDGLALVSLGRVLVGGSRNDLGQADGWCRVSICF